MNRRHTLLAAVAAACFGPLVARAQPAALPKGPVHIVVGFPPGGGTDVLARIIGQQLALLWNVPVLVENKAGAAGTIAADYVSKQPGDGSVLLMAHISSNGIAPGLFPKLGYSADKDFAPITMVGMTPMVLLCDRSQTVRTLPALVALCKREPGRVSFGSAGTGSAQHLALEEFKRRAGIDVLHVPYKGSAPLMNDLMGGQVQYCFEGMTTSVPHIRSGRLFGIAQTRLKRSPTLPEVPTIAEQGYAGFDAAIWFALAGPASMSADMVQQMNTDINKVLVMPEVAAKLALYGAEDGGGTPQQLGKFMHAEQLRWAKLIQEAHISMNA
ncbi:MAG: tripartite tricarboxylate transporter substrate binding protein [Pseudomonadota bacterium]|nr:tripartite tricarboxylate transporter substrate binding protein [Pseudomonadota bacterium]